MIDISRLLTQLNNTGIQNKDTPLYQFLKSLITTLKSNQDSITNVSNTITNNTTSNTTVSSGTQIVNFVDESYENDIISSPGSGSSGTNTIQVSGEVPAGAIDGVNKLFTTSKTYTPGYLFVYLNGVRQEITTDYTETTSTTFTFVVAPTIGDIILVDYIVTAGISGTVGPAGATGAQGPIGPVMLVEDGLPGEDGLTIPSIATSGTAGKLIQVVNTETGAVATGTTVIPFDDTIPQNTEGDQYLSLAITPTSATNNLKIEFVVHASFSVAGNWITAALFQDTGANAIAATSGFEQISTALNPMALTHVMLAGTTSATTFKVRIGANNAGTTTFNGQAAARKLGGVMISSLTITEYVP